MGTKERLPPGKKNLVRDCPLLRLLRGDQVTVGGPLDHTPAIDDFLHVQQALKTPVHGKTREFPFDDAGKPHKRADVKKPDRPESFVRREDRKARFLKSLLLPGEMPAGKRHFRIRKDHPHQIPVVFIAHLLGDE